MTPVDMLEELQRWREARWLRSLDLAFARFIHAQDAEAPAALLLAAALVAQLEGRGHSALPLQALAADPGALLDWPPEGIAALRQVLTDGPGIHLADGLGPARPVLEIAPANDAGASPLVLSRGLLYLRRYWRYETRVAAQIHARTALRSRAATLTTSTSGGIDNIEDNDDIDAAVARETLTRLFGPAGVSAIPDTAHDTGRVTDWQKVACALALRGRLTLITGGPGTGKTYTAARLLVLLQALHAGPQPLRVALAAPTGKAAARLRQSLQQALQGLREQPEAAGLIGAWADHLAPARTLHALLGTQTGTRQFRHDAAHPLELDVLFVDEASMVHLEMMAQLLEALPLGARVVLLGDKDQLASVEAGAVMGDLCQVSQRAVESGGATRDACGDSGDDAGGDSGDDAGGYRPATASWIARVAGQAMPPSSVGAGTALAQHTVVLRHSHRFDGPVGQLALAINGGDAATAVQLLQAEAGGAVAMRVVPAASAVLSLALQGRPGAVGGYSAYLKLLAQRPADVEAGSGAAAGAAAFDAWASTVLRSFDSFRVLCAVRDGPWGVAGLNIAIERALVDAGLLNRRGEWYEGRPVIVTRNDAALGVFNGDVGVVLRSPVPQGAQGADAALRCYFLDGDALRSVSVGRLADVETAFAMTVHKSQGSEFDHVLLVLPDDDVPVLTRELVYTGITRARRAFTLVCRQTAQLQSATARRTRRVSGLRGLL